MQIVDANVLLYAADAESAHHENALAWLEDALAGGEAVGFSWTVLIAFIRLSTGSVFPNALDAGEAIGQVEAWLDAPAAVAVEPGARHVHLLRGLLVEAGTAGNLSTDAHLAAIAIERDAELVSFDRDFARFGGLRHRVPAAGA